MAVRAQISLIANDEVGELAALFTWLRATPDLEGGVRSQSRTPGPGELGGGLETLNLALGTTASIVALAQALAAWLQSRRRSKLKLTITTPDGRTLELEAADSARAEELITELLRRDDGTDV
ncbi:MULTISPECIES: effector-associated constant component EACC1 [Actinomadura]|uniref:Uncharacterized protein n=1 Tax=Actinomadura yumaensis TaxID=111807 RepID=A0ABW2CJX4_9ACTN|nr:hypothetical protein [Actinomadura sp. J1-007]MWK33031.1 hypothetical protein [Actinomadura sp. J1-007]